MMEFSVSVFFYNPNIFPKEECGKRLNAEKIFCNRMKIDLIEGPYDHERWLKEVSGFDQEPEGGKRCELCIKTRLERTALKAKELEFDMFAATLTVSPHKSYDLVRDLGSRIAESTAVAFLDRDFKKKDGFKRSLELSKEYGLYRQSYCGCEFSKRNDR